jgi:hypothetical protein
VFELPPDSIKERGEVEVKIEKITVPPVLPESCKFGSGVYEFSIGGEYSYTFAHGVIIKLRFDPDLVGETDTPSIHYYDEASGQWINIGGSVSGDTISVEVDHFTKFAVLICKTTMLEPVQLLQTTLPLQPIQPPQNFADVTGHWAEANINRLLALGALSGYPDGNFKPDNPISRAEFVMVLVKAFHLEGQKGWIYDDTGGHWAKDYISIATSLDIVNGYSGTIFGPDDYITREQMAVMICKAAGISLLTEETGFADGDSISGWARGAVGAAARDKIINGYPDNTYQPMRTATRAEAAAVIVNALGK